MIYDINFIYKAADLMQPNQFSLFEFSGEFLLEKSHLFHEDFGRDFESILGGLNMPEV